MKKYNPSVVNNNKLKKEFTNNFNALIYKIKKGKFNSYINKESVASIIASLEECYDYFADTLGTGKENIGNIANESINNLNKLTKKFNQELISEIESASEDLIYSVNCWRDILEGKIQFTEGDIEKNRVTWRKKRLLSRLDELSEIKEQFIFNENCLDKDVISLEKDIDELNKSIIEENNERRLNELYRKVSTLKTKLDSLNIRKSNYNACQNLLDLIYTNAKEIIVLSDYSDVDLGKAKAFLNIGRLRQVMDDPNKAINILRKMEEDIKNITQNTKIIDTKISSINANTTSISSDALAYKEELLRKKHANDTLKDLEKDVISEKIKNEKAKGGK